MVDRYKEGYNQAKRDWEKKIQEEIKELKNMNIEGETFTTARNYAVLQLQDLLKKG